MLRATCAVRCLNSDFLRKCESSGISIAHSRSDSFRRAFAEAKTRRRFRGTSKTQSDDIYIRESTARERKLERLSSHRARREVGVPDT